MTVLQEDGLLQRTVVLQPGDARFVIIYVFSGRDDLALIRPLSNYSILDGPHHYDKRAATCNYCVISKQRPVQCSRCTIAGVMHDIDYVLSD